MKEKVEDVNIIELNVSGVAEGFTVKRKLLCSVSGSKLEALFHKKNSHMLKKYKGKIFVDRDPEIFKLVIRYLRNNFNSPKIKNDYVRELFENELEFWGLPI